MNSFEELGLNEEIINAVKELGFEKPTPIQAQTIPHLLVSKKDLIAMAQTGTGKTAAFGLPLIQLIDINDKNTQALVLCPTRELCVQIAKDFSNYSKNVKKLAVVEIYGGASIENQIRALSKGAQIVVATPGRAKDLIMRRKLNLNNVEKVVLDEADEMLSMGFKEELDFILSQTREDKQTLLFSATMSPDIKNITKKYMVNPIEIAAERQNTSTKNVQHIYYSVHAKDKYEVLKRIADMNPNIYGIVFCRTRFETKDIANKLMTDGYNADALHGDLSQSQRDDAMNRFRKGQLQILVATDIAARGLDVNDLTHVINFNLPDDPEVYIHRSGRTGRAGKTGISIVITHSREIRGIHDIERKYSITFNKELVPSGKDICSKQLFALIDKIEKVKVEEAQIEPFLPTIYKKLEWLDREQLIKHFVSAEFNRFLSYYKNAQDINVEERGQNKNDRSKRNDFDDTEANFVLLTINLGSKQSFNTLKMIEFINRNINGRKPKIGKIDVQKETSTFEIDNKHAEKLINNLLGKRIKDQNVEIAFAEGIKGFRSITKKRNKDYNRNDNSFNRSSNFDKKNKKRRF